MNRIERLTAILLLLQERPHTSLEIARKYEISQRTVLRDIQGLSEIGVPVIAQVGPSGGYSLPSGYSLAPLPLTAAEAFLLLLALSTITKLADTPFGPERSSLLAKLQALLPSAVTPSTEQWLAVAMIDVPMRQHRATFLEALLEAAHQQQWVEITYQSAERLSTQNVLPRQLTAQNGFWYCRAYSFEHQEERNYRVDRVQALAPANKSFQSVVAPKAQPYNASTHPEVIVRLTARGAANVESDQHLGPQLQRNPDGSGHLAFRCPPGEFDWHARFFAALGADAEVQAPVELRQKIAVIGHALIKVYVG